MARYDDAKFGVIERILLKPYQEATDITAGTPMLDNLYLRGPIILTKIGVQLRASANASSDCLVTFLKGTTTIATLTINSTLPAWSICSKTAGACTFPAGQHLRVKCAGIGGSVCNVHLFVDFHRKFDQADNKWDV